MNLNIDETLNQMLGAIKGETKNNWEAIKDTAGGFMQAKKERLELLSSLRLQNEINEDFFQQRLAEEKDILESEMHAMRVINKVAAQKAANAAMDVLQKAVQTAIRVA